MAANDYYDFNPSPTTWALMLTGFVVFVLVLSLLLILMVDRGADSGPAPAALSEPPVDQLPAPRPADVPVARAS
jgi:hypothetical protein